MFEFKAPPRLGSPALGKMLRAAVLASGRAAANADWLVRQCLSKAAPAWGKDPDFDFRIPGTITRLDRQSFRCGPRGQGKVGFEIDFHFQDARYFGKGE